jgi:hypothetical protein
VRGKNRSAEPCCTGQQALLGCGAALLYTTNELAAKPLAGAPCNKIEKVCS